MIISEIPAINPGLASLVNRVAQRLSTLGTGPAAELRRLRADAEDRWRSPAFYQLYASLIDLIEKGNIQDQDERERRWAMIVAGMVRLKHQSGRNAGGTLAEHGFSERRLVRLLDADEAHMASELRATVSFLSSKGASVNWTSLTDLVLSAGTDRNDFVRRTIASAYYRTLATKKA